LRLFAGKKAKKGVKNGVKNCAVPQTKLEEKMKRKKTKRKQQRCRVVETIDSIEQAVSTAKKVYRTIEPVVRAIIRNSRKAK
jgi:glycerol-3-phosphate cytidylyltransferase-like family protein